jgi:4-hydroxy-4-methyl-2-oxoglutarate aldolase
MVGPAVTVQAAAGENGTIHRALEIAEPGSVLVMSSGGNLERAVWGGVLAHAAVARRIAGVVVDGAVRDVSELMEIGIPTYACGRTPLGPHKAWPGRIGIPVACGDVIVSPGDIVIGDLDGVAVIPSAAEEKIYDEAEARLTLEQQWLERIARGESTVRILGLDSND